VADLSAGRLWRLAKHAVVFEVRLYRSLARWAFRRPDLGRPEDVPVGYSRLAAPVMWLWIFGSAAEIPVIHFAVPWESVRIPLLAVGVWGLAWMLGLFASWRVYPHLLGSDRIRIRHGAGHDVHVPWSAVQSVTTRALNLDSSIWVLDLDERPDGVAVRVAVSGEVNVHLHLREPTPVRTAKGEVDAVEVSFLADDPREVVARIRALLAADAKR
jgi:hypothetical protein